MKKASLKTRILKYLKRREKSEEVIRCVDIAHALGEDTTKVWVYLNRLVDDSSSTGVVKDVTDTGTPFYYYYAPREPYAVAGAM